MKKKNDQRFHSEVVVLKPRSLGFSSELAKSILKANPVMSKSVQRRLAELPDKKHVRPLTKTARIFISD